MFTSAHVRNRPTTITGYLCNATLHLLDLLINCFKCPFVTFTISVGQVVGAPTHQKCNLEKFFHEVDDAVIVR